MMYKVEYSFFFLYCHWFRYGEIGDRPVTWLISEIKRYLTSYLHVYTNYNIPADIDNIQFWGLHT